MSEPETKEMNLSSSQIKRYLRAKRREGLLTEEQIARLDANRLIPIKTRNIYW